MKKIRRNFKATDEEDWYIGGLSVDAYNMNTKFLATLVGVQPLTAPMGKIFTLKPKYLYKTEEYTNEKNI